MKYLTQITALHFGLTNACFSMSYRSLCDANTNKFFLYNMSICDLSAFS